MSKINFVENPDYVYFIHDLMIKELPPTAVVEYWEEAEPSLFSDGSMPFIHESQIQRRQCEVHSMGRYHRGKSERAYFAVSHEVQEVLGMPFDALKQRAESQERENQKLHTEIGIYRGMNILDRLILVFTKKPSSRFSRYVRQKRHDMRFFIAKYKAKLKREAKHG